MLEERIFKVLKTWPLKSVSIVLFLLYPTAKQNLLVANFTQKIQS